MRVPPELAGQPDRLRWNARYAGGFEASFHPHPLAERALSLRLPGGPVLDLASGPSGSALLAAAAGRRVTVVDVSEVALGLLREEAVRRGLSGLITFVQADLAAWHPPPDRYALVLCTGYWDRTGVPAAAGAGGGGRLSRLTHGARGPACAPTGSWVPASQPRCSPPDSPSSPAARCPMTSGGRGEGC